MSGTGGKSGIGMGTQQMHQTMSSEYYRRNQAKLSKQQSPETSTMNAAQSQQQPSSGQNRSKSKTGAAAAAQFLKRRGSEDKKESPQKAPHIGTQRSGIYFQEYLEHNKARSPKVIPSKQLESLRAGQESQMASNGMF